MSGAPHLGPTGEDSDAAGDTALRAPSDGVGLPDEDNLHTGRQGAEPGGRGGQ